MHDSLETAQESTVALCLAHMARQCEDRAADPAASPLHADAADPYDSFDELSGDEAPKPKVLTVQTNLRPCGSECVSRGHLGVVRLS